MRKALLALLLCFACHGCAVGPVQSTAPPKAILLIGDGMDDHQIAIARNYLVGHEGLLTLDQMPHRSAVRVQTVSESDPRIPVYVADSANTATSMATGIVTSAGRISTTASSDRDAVTILELAAAAGFGTGIVTTASVTDATPAAFVAHINWRLCEGPRTMVTVNPRNPAFAGDCSAHLKANGGKGSIAEQIADSRIDIVLGGGMQHFAQVAEGESTRTVHEIAASNGFRVVETAADLVGVSSDSRVLGLFSPSTMPVQWRGERDARAELVARVDGVATLPEPFGCEPNPDFAGMPRLAEMTAAALRHVDDGRPFMLLVESASIDKQSHLRRPCGQIGELAQLDETLALILDYQRRHPETLVLVTADHSQAAQLVPARSALRGAASPGRFARLRTLEGAIMGVSYATNDSDTQEDHSGADVPLIGSGPGLESMPALIAQRQIFQLLAEHLGLELPSPVE
jgi:alkaline phosphatase